MVSYDEWFDKTGYKILEELEDWLDECPSPFMDTSSIDIAEILEDEYESFLGELEDRAYEDYRDSLLED